GGTVERRPGALGGRAARRGRCRTRQPHRRQHGVHDLSGPTLRRMTMKALLYGVKPDPVTPPETDNFLLRNLAQTPMKLVEMDEPRFLLPDWVVAKPRLTGICGSDAKQVFMDWGEVRSPDNPMKAFFSLPQVLGHEVVADVVALGPQAEGLEIGD